MKRIALALLFAAAAAPACAQQTPPAPPAPAGQITCTMPRPQVCTKQYRPVCGARRDGTRQTYGNACEACADPNVASHVSGPCN
jgi:hypothetical protein